MSARTKQTARKPAAPMLPRGKAPRKQKRQKLVAKAARKSVSTFGGKGIPNNNNNGLFLGGNPTNNVSFGFGGNGSSFGQNNMNTINALNSGSAAAGSSGSAWTDYLELDDFMTALDDQSLNRLSTAQLMQRLKSHGLPYRGLKHELIARWKEYKMKEKDIADHA